jgi:hypothetical protein
VAIHAAELEVQNVADPALPFDRGDVAALRAGNKWYIAALLFTIGTHRGLLLLAHSVLVGEPKLSVRRRVSSGRREIEGRGWAMSCRRVHEDR